MKNHLSLNRLSFLYHRSQLPEKLQIGARLIQMRQNKGIFSGQNCLLIVDQLDENQFSLGDLVVIEADGDDLYFEGQNGSTKESFYLRKFTGIKVLSNSRGEFEIKGGDPVNFQKWNNFIVRVKDSLENIGLNSVSTPSLVPSPGTEPFLDSFATKFKFGTKEKEFFLPTSPELHLKKLMCIDHTDIYEIRSCFRNGEISESHQPEFTMLEWYRAFSDLETMKTDVESLFLSLAKQYEIDENWDHIGSISVAQLFKRNLDFELKPNTSLEELTTLAFRFGLDSNFNHWEDVFNWLFVSHIEKHLPMDKPVFVQDYPFQLAALSKINCRGWADRFEIYYKGFEIGNAFNELTDLEEHQLRYKNDCDLREKMGKSCPPKDEQFLRAIGHGLPPSSGIAVGMERLFMAFNNYSKIEDFKAFSFKTNED